MIANSFISPFKLQPTKCVRYPYYPRRNIRKFPILYTKNNLKLIPLRSNKIHHYANGAISTSHEVIEETYKNFVRKLKIELISSKEK